MATDSMGRGLGEDQMYVEELSVTEVYHEYMVNVDLLFGPCDLLL